MSYKWTQDYVPKQRNWQRATKSQTCKICKKSDWCSYTDDGELACCMRVAEGSVKAVDQGHGMGYIHVINDQATYASPVRCYAAPTPTKDWLKLDNIIDTWRATQPPNAIETLAAELGVSIESLHRLNVTWASDRHAWAFPMCDDRRQIVGIRLRSPNSSKYSLKNGKSGIFLPRKLTDKTTLLICEGPTDTAAAITLGYEAIGRPSATGGVSIICDIIAAGRRRDVVVVADRDDIGVFGAQRLADRLMGISRTVKIIKTTPHKDLRVWTQAGDEKTIKSMLKLRIENAKFYRRD